MRASPTHPLNIPTIVFLSSPSPPFRFPPLGKESVSGSAGPTFGGAGGAAVSTDDVGSRFITLRNPGTGKAGRYLVGGSPAKVYVWENERERETVVANT